MGPSIGQLLIVLVIILVLFGAKRLKSLGGDMGAAIKNFKSAIKEAETDADNDQQNETQKLEKAEDSKIIEAEVSKAETHNEKV